MDWRILLLQLCNRHPLLLHTIYTVIFLSFGITSLVLEYEKKCEEVDLHLWLILSLFRMALRLILRHYISCATHHIVALQGSALVLQKFADLLDLFGIIWFAVGNLLLFNNTLCESVIPFTFGTCLAYIVATYFIVGVPICLKLTLASCPPSSEADLLALQGWGNRYLAPPFMGNTMREGVSQLTEEQGRRWKRWLEEEGCAEIPFQSPPSHQSDNDEKGLAEEKDQNDAWVVCAICLTAFEEAEQLVPYPCQARHLFHPACLRSWLQVCYERTGRLDGLSCPCCRQHPRSTVTSIANSDGVGQAV